MSNVSTFYRTGVFEMSRVTDLHTYIEDLRATVPYVHPAARATIHHWLQDMHAAADQDDTATVARLARCVSDKIEQEIEWCADGS
jgi:hypothetical protein